MTSVEVAVGVAVIGSVLAVAVPSFTRDLHASRFTEPVAGIGHIGSSAVAYAHERPARTAFPPSAPLTPSAVPRGIRVVDPPGAWDHPTWAILGFRASPEGAPHAYSFAFDDTPGPTRSTFVAHAHGDLDGDGVTSTFEIRGHAAGGEGQGGGHGGGGDEASIEPGMYVDAEIE